MVEASVHPVVDAVSYRKIRHFKRFLFLVRFLSLCSPELPAYHGFVATRIEFHPKLRLSQRVGRANNDWHVFKLTASFKQDIYSFQFYCAGTCVIMLYQG